MSAWLLTGLLLLAGFSLNAQAAPSGDLLIVPGKRIGLTPLGPQGSRTLAALPRPSRADATMSQRFLVWIAKTHHGRLDTLFIHAVSNGALDVRPLDGVTIDTIRITSPQFIIQESGKRGGSLHVGSTLAQIRRRFPRISPTDSSHTLYDDSRRGIAFEFSRPARSNSQTLAVMIHPPGNPYFAKAGQVRNLLQPPPP